MWTCTDQGTTTQYLDPLGEHSAPNLLTQHAAIHNMATPPGSPYATPVGTPPSPEWLHAPPNDQSQPGMFVDQAYHTTTQLLDGRKPLLIDPGSVGSLCREK